MCGFAGIISNSVVSESTVRSMGETILHRGPDYTGYFFDHRSGFVHNRLSLLDVSSNGNQPYVDDRHVLLFNGEIYNHSQLRKEYLPEAEFKSTSDTETLFHLLSKYGVQRTSELLNGMFAFAWYDRQNGEIYLVRDRIGIKPLFYMIKAGQLIFSSELKAISCHFELQPDRLLIMSSTLGELEYSRKHTAFIDVKQLEPGTILHFKDEGLISTDYFFRITDLVDESYYRELHSMPDDALAKEFDQILNKSVISMLMSDVGMGAFVSGGLDSSLITSMAARHQSITMYTANVVGKYSELKACQSVADYLQQTLHIYDYEPEFFIRDLVHTTWHYECPITVHGSALPFNGVACLARSTGTKAVLTGEGSDELFLGYPRLLTRKLDGILKLPYLIFDKAYSSVPGLTKYLNLNKNNFSNDLLYMPFISARKGDDIQYMNAYSFVDSKRKAMDHSLTLEMLGRGLHSLLWRNDRIGMMHSIESRFPFLDESLMRFAANMPINLKIGKTASFHNVKHPFRMDKKIVRELAKKYVPKGIEKIEKKGFAIFGHGSLKISSGFFRDGFISDILLLTKRDTDLLEKNTDSYLLSKLSQVEIWGRLFLRKESANNIQNHVNTHMSMRKTY